MAERRRMERFDLTTPARLFVVSEGGENARLSLTTKDVSSAGAYVYCQQPPVEGARVRMELLLSLDRVFKVGGENGSTRIRVRGKVVRVDTDGIAISFESKYKITALGSGDREVGLL